jgi:flagellin
MSVNINLNLTAYSAMHRLQSHQSNLSRAIHRLSSGLKLNSAADSPVDMAVHNVNSGRLETLKKGRQNIQDAITTVQTAEASMADIDALLVEMKRMAEQASTGTFTPEQRVIIASEFATFSSEIDRIAHYTEYKGIKLLDGSLSSRNNYERQGSYYTTDRKHLNEDDLMDPEQNGLKIHFGPSNDRLTDYYFIKIDDMKMKSLCDKTLDVTSQHSSQITLETINSAILKKEQNRYSMGIYQNRLEATLNEIENEILNLTGADSKLTDADFTEEMMNFVRYNLMSEATTAMISQANILPKTALKLLNF